MNNDGEHQENSWLAHLLTEGIYIIPHERAEDPDDASQEVNNDFVTEPVFRGKNKKHVLILVPGSPDSGQEELLIKIIGAVDLTWEDIALVNWSEHSRPDLHHQLNAHVVISFGLDADPWCDAELYEVTQANRITHLRAEALSTVMNDVEAKKKLWKALRAMYGK